MAPHGELRAGTGRAGGGLQEPRERPPTNEGIVALKLESGVAVSQQG